MFAQPETWVAIAFVILMVLFAYLGIHKTVLTALDHRAQRIKAELDDAKRLREEAAKLLGEYQTRRASAEREAEEIIANARAEAERIATEAKAKMEDFVARRTKTAESKIALAEAQALADVRAAAAEAAVAAASTVLTQTVKGPVAETLLATTERFYLGVNGHGLGALTKQASEPIYERVRKAFAERAIPRADARHDRLAMQRVTELVIDDVGDPARVLALA